MCRQPTSPWNPTREILANGRSLAPSSIISLSRATRDRLRCHGTSACLFPSDRSAERNPARSEASSARPTTLPGQSFARKVRARCYAIPALPAQCSERRADLIAEALGLAWRWFRRLAQRGKDGTQFPSPIATFAAKAVNSGRRVCGQEKGRDVLSPLAQRRNGFAVGKLPDFDTLSANPLAEALTDNTQSPVADQAAFRIDFSDWLDTFGSRRRSIIVNMGMGCRTQELADKYGVSEGRISQMRREAAEDWHRFQGEQAA